MPQNLTHNPSILKVGDKVWILKTTNTIHKLENQGTQRLNTSQIFKPIPCTMLEIKQTLKENNLEGTGGPRKRIFEYRIIPLCVDNNKTEIINATHLDNIFHTLEDLNKWIKEKMKEWNKISKEHNERHEEIKEILYITD